MVFEVRPLMGIGPVRLGMSPGEVRIALGLPVESFTKHGLQHPVDAFLGSQFQVFYGDPGPSAEYIELSLGDKLTAIFDGLNIFETPAQELVAHVSALSPLGDDPEAGFAFTFPNLELSFWRPTLPEDENDPDGRFFATVGIGVPGYFSSSLTK